MSDENLKCGCGGNGILTQKIRFADYWFVFCDKCKIQTSEYLNEEQAIEAFKKATRAELDKEIECLNQQMNGAMTIMKGRAKEVTELKHVLFENVIAPNCPTCSNQMSNYCDNGQICMSKLLNAEFVRWDIKKLEAENAELKKEILACVDTRDCEDNKYTMACRIMRLAQKIKSGQ